MATRRRVFASGGIQWDEGAIRILLDSEEGEVGVDLMRRARAVQKRAQRAAPEKTGHLKGSIKVDPMTHDVNGPSVTITAGADYAAFVEFGRGTVYPVSKQMLHWVGDFTDVFALSASAVPATHFMSDSLDAINE